MRDDGSNASQVTKPLHGVTPVMHCAQQKAVGERGDRRDNRQKEELREILRVTTRGIQFACVKVIVRRLNELAIYFRENKPSIDNLRLQLAIVRRPVRL